MKVTKQQNGHGTAVATAAQINPEQLLADAEATPAFHQDDVAIPFLKVLQSLSPEVIKANPKYVKGAEAGMFFNTVSQQLWPGTPGIIVLPVFHRLSVTEWKPRASAGGGGGGFVQDHGEDRELVNKTPWNDERHKRILPNGNELVAAQLYYVMIVDPETGDYVRAALSLTGKQFTKAKKWNAVMSGLLIPNPVDETRKINPPPFYFSYQINTIHEHNDKGEWEGVVITPFKPTPLLADGLTLYEQASKYRKMILSGAVKLETPLEEDAAGDPLDDRV